MGMFAKRLACGGLAAMVLGGALCSAANAARFVDPSTLPPKARHYALYGKLGDHDPYGRPAEPGCQWSRIQTPTAHGLRWVAEEECNPDFWH